MTKKIFTVLFFVSFFVFAQKIDDGQLPMFYNQYGDVFEYDFSSKSGDLNLSKLPVSTICGCHQGPSQTTTLLGSCCWDTPSATTPTCHSAAGTGKSCI